VVRDRVDLPSGSVLVITDPGGATVALWQEAGR
jgi:predicted enzyme related to lactoylglutathione lyase